MDCNFKATSKVRSSVNKHLACDSKKFIQREGYKSERRMPRLLEAKKDVVSCEKPWELQTGFDPGISEWGNPAG